MYFNPTVRATIFRLMKSSKSRIGANRRKQRSGRSCRHKIRITLLLGVEVKMRTILTTYLINKSPQLAANTSSFSSKRRPSR